MNEIDVEEVEEALGYVHERLCCGEAIFGIPRREAVDVVDVHVKLVRRPDPVQVTPKHTAWSQKNVADIPGNDKGAEEQPSRDEQTRTVDCQLCGGHLGDERISRDEAGGWMRDGRREEGEGSKLVRGDVL